MKYFLLLIQSLLSPWASTFDNGTRSSFNSDLERLEIFQEYLDRFVYPYLMPYHDWSYKRIKDLDGQNRGIDILLQYKDKTFKIDEKAQLDYLDVNIPTMAFELAYYKNNLYREGWLFDEKKETSHYIYITNINTKEGKGFRKPEDILSCKMYLVRRKSLIGELAKIDMDHKNLIDFYEKHQDAGEAILFGFGKSKIKFTGHKNERPLNLVIHQSSLMELLGSACEKIWDQHLEFLIKSKR